MRYCSVRLAVVGVWGPGWDGRCEFSLSFAVSGVVGFVVLLTWSYWAAVTPGFQQDNRNVSSTLSDSQQKTESILF